MIYLDYAANTPVDERVIESFTNATRKYIANPNSSHFAGLDARKEIERCSEVIGKYFNTSKDNVIYTSGASESNNLVIKGIAQMYKDKGNKIIISALEHSSIVAPCNYLASLGYEISVIPLTKDGMIDLDILKKEMNDKVILVSIATVDSELGTIQPIDKVAQIVKKYPNAIFHTDATQAIGKVNVGYDDVDFLTFTPHKFFGLNGSGALINRSAIKIIPLIHGGKSTTIYRSGTPVTAMAIAMERAFSLATGLLSERYDYVKKLNDYVRNALKDKECVHINSPLNTIPNTINISLIGKDTKAILKSLEEKGICLSTTTACSIGNAPSKSVLAITGDESLAANTIRISMSHLTTKEEIDIFLENFEKLISK